MCCGCDVAIGDGIGLDKNHNGDGMVGASDVDDDASCTVHVNVPDEESGGNDAYEEGDDFELEQEVVGGKVCNNDDDGYHNENGGEGGL